MRSERGARRVDVDDLMALAEGLNVSPIALLMPKAETKDELVQATGHPPERAQVLLWSKLLALSIRGLGVTTEPTLKAPPTTAASPIISCPGPSRKP